MAGNTLGQNFRVTTFGEAHGSSIGAIIDGCPAGIPLSIEDIQLDLNRRRPGSNQFTSQRQEPDQVEILSGVKDGITLGTSIGLIIHNKDTKSSDYEAIKDRFRPGHADFSYYHKYGIYDHRGGGRASARETAMRVAAGAVAKKVLKTLSSVSICGYLSQIGNIIAEQHDLHFSQNNPFFFPDQSKLRQIEQLITQLRRDGDSIGAEVELIASRVPVGLGEPVFNKLDADIAHAMMSIPAVKGVSIGDGFKVIQQKGSEHRDEITPTGFSTNHAGGILGGISTGQSILVTLALKPASSIRIPGKSITTEGKPCEVVTTGRHDPCVGIRAVPVAEAMLAIVLMDHFLLQRSQNPSNINRGIYDKETEQKNI